MVSNGLHILFQGYNMAIGKFNTLKRDIGERLGGK